MIIMETFSDWLKNELNIRGMSQADLARATGFSKQFISQLINETRKPSNDACKAIADVLMLDTQYVFRIAKILPPTRNEASPVVQEIIQLVERIPAPDQQHLLQIVRAYTQRYLEKE